MKLKLRILKSLKRQKHLHSAYFAAADVGAYFVRANPFQDPNTCFYTNFYGDTGNGISIKYIFNEGYE